MAGGRDQASYSFPPQTQPCSYPGAANPYTDAELKRLEILRLEEARRDRDRQDRKEREAYDRQRDAAHQRAMELQGQMYAHQAT
jgi:hypothetical protein